MYLTAFDLETVARLCSLFKKSCPPVRVCVDEQDSERVTKKRERECVCYLLCAAVKPGFL